MWKKWLAWGGTLVVCAVLAQQVATTVYLAKIDQGLHSSLHSTKTLANVQQSIIAKNAALKGMAKTAKEMNGKLSTTLQVTEQIDKNIQEINRLNKATLGINNLLVGIGDKSHTNIEDVSGNITQLNQAMTQLHQSIAALDQTLASDETSLQDIKVQSDQMNAKTPGVNP